MRYFVLGMGLLVGCGQKTPTQHVRVAIGEDTQMPIQGAVSEEFRQMTGAIGLMTGNCTVFHLGDGIAATAGHCFEASSKKSERRPCLTKQIQWQMDGESKEHVSQCVEILVLEHDEERDFALFRVDPIPASFVALSSSPPKALDPLVILGHPEGKPLHVSKDCNLTRALNGNQFAHNCDTKPGNSGSPVFHADTGEVLLLHDGGADDENYGMSSVVLTDALAKAQRTPPLSQPFLGPYDDNMAELLYVIPSSKGSYVSLALDIDVEDGFDMVKITDGGGWVRRLTGRKTERFEKMKTPVIVGFESDYAGASQKVEIEVLQVF